MEEKTQYRDIAGVKERLPTSQPTKFKMILKDYFQHYAEFLEGDISSKPKEAMQNSVSGVY